MTYAQLKAGHLDPSTVNNLSSAATSSNNPLFHAYYGELLFVQGETERALAYVDEAISLEPDLGLPHLIHGKILLAQGLEDEAREYFDATAGLALPSAHDYHRRSEINASLGLFDHALSDSNNSILINPKFPEYYYLRHKIFSALEAPDNSKSDLAVALKLSLELPNNPDISNTSVYLKGMALKEVGKLEEATKLITDRLLLHKYPIPGTSSLFENSGSVQQHSLDLLQDIYTEQGVNLNTGYFTKLITQNPDNHIASYFRGLAFLTLGNMVQAAADFEDALLGKNISPDIKAFRAYTSFFSNKPYDIALATPERYLAYNDYADTLSNHYDNIPPMPRNALFYALFAEMQMVRMHHVLDNNWTRYAAGLFFSNVPEAYNPISGCNRIYDEVFKNLKKSVALDPTNGLAYLLESEIFLSIGQNGTGVIRRIFTANSLALH